MTQIATDPSQSARLIACGIDPKSADMMHTPPEIESLERGEYNYYIPQTYINKVKKWIK